MSVNGSTRRRPPCPTTEFTRATRSSTRKLREASALESSTTSKETAPKPKRVTRARTTTATTAAPSTTTNGPPTASSTSAKPTRGRKRSAAVAAAAAAAPAPESSSTHEETASKPKRATRARTTATVTNGKPAARPTRSRGRKKEDEPKPEPKELEKIEETNWDQEILPTVFDVIEDIKQELERTIEEITGKVMTFGDDMCGELGLKETGMTKKRPVFVEISEPVVHIVSGGMHNVCVTSNGKVYSWGCNDEGALGRKTDVDDRDLSAEPTKVPLPCDIIKVSAGDSHSAALTATGAIYIWGNFKDSNGQIGLTPDSLEGKIDPIQIDIPNLTFVDLASGNDHLLLLTNNGEVYSIGVGEQGQLGRFSPEEMKQIKEHKELFLKPSLVKFDGATICDRIWAGQYSSFARSKTGEIYAWGLNNYSQLGFKLSNEQLELTVPFPVLVPSFSKIGGSVEQICPGQHFILTRDSQGRVYSCGRHEYGRLGHGKNEKSLDEPELIESLEKELIKQIAAGSVTSFAVSEKGDLYAWGMNGAALGVGDDDAWVPTRVTSKSLEGSKVISVAAGAQHTAIIVQPKTG